MEEEYEEYEGYYEDAGPRNRLWIILFAIAMVIALVFGTLWFLRGQDIDRLNTAITSNQSAASATTSRLERELTTARTTVETGTAKIQELENRIRDEQRRATDMAQQVERRLRDEADAANARAHELTSQITRLKAELEKKPGSSVSPTEVAGIAAGSLPLQAELEEVKRQLTDARESAEAREKELYQRLADAVKEKEALAGTVGDLKASLNNIGLELTTANEDIKDIDSLREQAGILQKQIDAANETIKTQEEKIGDLEANNSHLRGELASAQETLRTATPSASAPDQKAEALQLLNPDSSNIQKEVTTASAIAAGAAAIRISGLETKITSLEANIAELKEKNTALAAERDELQASLKRTEADLNLAQAGTAELEQLCNDFSSAQKTVEVLRGQIATYESEQEKLRNDMSELNLQLQKAQSEATRAALLESELETAKKDAAESALQISSLTETQTGLRKDLDAAYADLQKAQSGEGDSPQGQSELQNRIVALSDDLNTAKQQHAEATKSLAALQTELESARASASERENALTASLERLEQENREINELLNTWKNSVPKPESGIQTGESANLGSDVHEAIAKLEAGAEEAQEKTKTMIAGLEKRIGDLEKDKSDLLGELEKAKQDLGKVRTNAAKNLTAAREEYSERLANERKRLNERLEVLRDQQSKSQKELSKAKDEEHKEQAASSLSGTPAGAAGVFAASTRKDSTPDSVAMVEVIEPTKESTSPMHFYIKDPDRTVGTISALPEKGGFEISVGSKQGVKPGMLFDVHRSLGSMNWFIGVLRVDRTMSNTSETTLVPRDGVKICPVTGRAILDPQSKYSPYVYADGGKAVPLIPAESLGLGGEMPVAGDLVDNPYFDPSRKLVFSVKQPYEGMANRELADLVDALGGEMKDKDAMDEASDFLIVMEEKPETILDEPPHVTPAQLSSYVEF